jgi:membrane protein
MSDPASVPSPSTDRGRTADDPTEIPMAGWKDIALRVKDQMRSDHVTLSSAGVAFFGFTALIPMLAATVSIYGLIAAPSDLTSLVNRIRGAAPPEVADMLQQQLESITSSSSGALGVGALVGVLVALWSASSGMAHLVEAINIAYDEDVDDRSFWLRRLLALGLTLGVLVAVATVATVFAVAGAVGGGVGVVVDVAGWVLTAAIASAALAVLYRNAPDRDAPEWRWATPGAAVAIVSILISSFLFRLYVTQFGSYNETYGALGAIVVVLTWLFLVSMTVVVGAEINAELEHQTAVDTTTGDE